MVSILVIAHQPLASALVAAAQHVYSRDPCAAATQLHWIDVPPGADPEQSLAQARALVAQIDEGSGVLVLTDLAGATPGNVAARLALPGRVAVVAGASMPMLLRALCYAGMAVDEVARKAAEAAGSGTLALGSAPG